MSLLSPSQCFEAKDGDAVRVKTCFPYTRAEAHTLAPTILSDRVSLALRQYDE
jgi:hypothetical protein